MQIKNIAKTVKGSFEVENKDGEMESVGFTLRRMKFSLALREKFQEAMERADKDPEIIGKLLADHIAAWELYEDAERTKMYPITVENIINEDFVFVMSLFEAVMSKLFANPQKAATSDNGLEAAANSDVVKNFNSATTSHSLAASGE